MQRGTNYSQQKDRGSAVERKLAMTGRLDFSNEIRGRELGMQQNVCYLRARSGLCGPQLIPPFFCVHRAGAIGAAGAAMAAPLFGVRMMNNSFD